NDLEAVMAKALVIGQRRPQVSQPDYRHTPLLGQTENLHQMLAQILDVIPDAAYAEFAEIGQIFANLRRIEIELISHRLRRDSLPLEHRQFIQAAQID